MKLLKKTIHERTENIINTTITELCFKRKIVLDEKLLYSSFFSNIDTDRKLKQDHFLNIINQYQQANIIIKDLDSKIQSIPLFKKVEYYFENNNHNIEVELNEETNILIKNIDILKKMKFNELAERKPLYVKLVYFLIKDLYSNNLKNLTYENLIQAFENIQEVDLKAEKYTYRRIEKDVINPAIQLLKEKDGLIVKVEEKRKYKMPARYEYQFSYNKIDIHKVENNEINFNIFNSPRPFCLTIEKIEKVKNFLGDRKYLEGKNIYYFENEDYIICDSSLLNFYSNFSKI